MPRTLPWLLDKSKKQSTSSATSRPRERPRAPLSETAEDVANTSTARLPPTTPARPTNDDDEPPSSPPPVAEALPVEYMHEGFNADDRFRMVEDEFLSTARLFTRHLHADEYALHKRRVQARGTETISGLQRATDGQTAQSDIMKVKKKAQARSKAVRMAVSGMISDASATDTEDDAPKPSSDLLADPFAGFAPREDFGRINLSAAVKPKVNTRAAAGFLKSPEKAIKYKDVIVHHIDEDDDSEDLDAVMADSFGKQGRHSQRRDDWLSLRAETTSIRKHQASTPHHGDRVDSSARLTSIRKDAASIQPQDDISDLSIHDSGRSAASAFLARRKAALEGKQKAKDEDNRTASHNA